MTTTLFQELADLASGRKRLRIDVEDVEESLASPARTCPRISGDHDFMDIDAILEEPLEKEPIQEEAIETESIQPGPVTPEKSIPVRKVRRVENVSELPLNTTYSELFVIQDETGRKFTVMSLTDDVVHQMNAILKYERLIDPILEKAKRIEQEIFSNEDILRESQEVRPDIEESIDTMQHELNRWMAKADKVKKAVSFPRTCLYDLWKDLLENDLLEPSDAHEMELDPEEPRSSPEQHEAKPPPARVKPASPTPSMIRARECEEAEKDVYNKELAYEDAKQKYNDWRYKYKGELAKFQEALECEDDHSTTQTVFDHWFLRQSNEAYIELQAAEAAFLAARQIVRDLGIIRHSPDQESQFPEYADDGYRMSQELEEVQNMDRSFVEMWLKEQDMDFEPEVQDEEEGD